LKKGFNTYRQSWDKVKDNPKIRPYRGCDLLNSRLNNFKITDDVCIVISLANERAHDHFKDKGYELLKGKDKKGFGL